MNPNKEIMLPLISSLGNNVSVESVIKKSHILKLVLDHLLNLVYTKDVNFIVKVFLYIHLRSRISPHVIFCFAFLSD